MGNISDYIKWRGDIELSEKPFNEIDNLILSVVAYIDFLGIVPSVKENRFITLKEAYNSMNKIDSYKIHGFLNVPVSFWRDVSNSERFGNAKMYNYIDICDENRKMQFAALHIELDDETVYIAFRGTDQTIVGWKEDFSMSFEVVPTQVEAVEYLEKTMDVENKEYRIGGHSKGGNLAVYSSIMCKDILKNRIIKIYDNDGPGFCNDILELENYEEIQQRITRIIPEFSVIGTLFHKDNPQIIVKSSVNGIMQHDPMTWLIEGKDFLNADELHPKCIAISEILDTWLEDVNVKQRQIFTDNFFNALKANGAKSINDVATSGIEGFESILTAMASSEKVAKVVVVKLIKSTMKKLGNVDYINLFKEKRFLRQAFTAGIGLFFMQLPEHALQIISTIVILAIIFFSIERIRCNTKQKEEKGIVSKYSRIFYISVIILGLIFLFKQNSLVLSANFSLGAILIGSGAMKLRGISQSLNKSKNWWWVPLANAIISIVLGVVALVSPNDILTTYIFVLGSLMVIKGIKGIISEIINIENIEK